jgi:hypothetical protein
VSSAYVLKTRGNGVIAEAVFAQDSQRRGVVLRYVLKGLHALQRAHASLRNGRQQRESCIRSALLHRAHERLNRLANTGIPVREIVGHLDDVQVGGIGAHQRAVASP